MFCRRSSTRFGCNTTQSIDYVKFDSKPTDACGLSEEHTYASLIRNRCYLEVDAEHGQRAVGACEQVHAIVDFKSTRRIVEGHTVGTSHQRQGTQVKQPAIILVCDRLQQKQRPQVKGRRRTCEQGPADGQVDSGYDGKTCQGNRRCHLNAGSENTLWLKLPLKVPQ